MVVGFSACGGGSVGGGGTTVLLFPANDAANGRELWKTDGTAEGTVLVKDINPGATGSFPDGFTPLNGAWYFAAMDGTNGDELWKTDGGERTANLTARQIEIVERIHNKHFA